MKVLLLVGIMIAGLLLSVSSVYLSKIVLADDNWSDIAKRQGDQQARAALIYSNKYQFDNLDQSKRDWTGLFFTSTDENSKGRDIAGKAQMSLENAMSEFDKIHVRQLVELQNTGYAGLTSVTTDEQARDRNALISQARDQTDKQVTGLVSQLSQIAQLYTNMSTVTTTDEKTIDRQAQVQKTWDSMEAQAATLLNSIWQIDQNYVNIQYGGTTNENTPGRQLTEAQAHALQNAVTIFEEIHAKRLAALGSNYNGLTSSTTNENVYADRNTDIENAREMALQNAINFYNAYYPGTSLSQPNYSH